MTDREREPESAPRLLIVSYYFPPSESVGGRRPAALAAFALARGWDVRVLTAFGADQGAEPNPVPETRLIRALPSPHIPRPKRFVAGSTVDGAVHRMSRLDRLRAGVNRSLVRAGLEVLLPDPQINWIRPAIRAFHRAAGDWRPDVVLVSAPPFSGFLVATAIARRLGVPWVADYRDLWSVGNEYWVRSAPRRALDEKLERHLLRSVTTCVTVSEPLAEKVRRTFGVDTRVVMNGIDRRPLPARSADARPGGNDQGRATLTLAHTGYVYPGKRNPGPLFDAIAMLGPDAPRVHVVFAGEDHGIVRAAAERAGVADSVTNLGYVAPEKSWQIQADADALVLLMWNNPRDAGTVTGKIFDYLQAQRPVLLLGYEGGVTAKLLRDRNAGVVCNDPTLIAAQLREWLAVKERTGRLPAVPATAMDGLFREDQLGPYLQILRDAAGGRAGVRDRQLL